MPTVAPLDQTENNNTDAAFFHEIHSIPSKIGTTMQRWRCKIADPIIKRVFPLPLWLVLGLYAILPQSCFLNRGYTIWFHWGCLAFFLSRNKTLAKFLALQGTAVSVGWYASMVYDFVIYGHFCYNLYWNVPDVMRQYIFGLDNMNKTAQPLMTPEAISMMFLAHVLDAVAHPVLALYFWNHHIRQHHEKKNKQDNRNQPYREHWSDCLFTWPLVLSSYCLWRVWCMVHVYHNESKFGLFYMGFDVYRIETSEMCAAVYVAEGIMYVGIVMWKLFWQNRNINVNGGSNNKNDIKSKIIHRTRRTSSTKVMILLRKSAASSAICSARRRSSFSSMAQRL